MSNAYIQKYSHESLHTPGTGAILRGNRFSVKGNFSVKGEAVTFGLNPPIIKSATSTARSIQYCLDQGGILTGSTNLDPLAVDMRGENEFFGDIKNPLNKTLPCLGSSAGAAASIIEDNLDFALCTDSGGSVRAPGASCSLFGLKLSPHPELSEGVLLSDPHLDCLGILAPSINTLRKVLQTFHISPQSESEAFTVYIPDLAELSFCDSEVQLRFSEVTAELSRSFTLKTWPYFGLFEESLALRKKIMGHYVSELLKTYSGKLPERVAALQLYGKSLSVSDLEVVSRRVEAIQVIANNFFDSQKILLTPTLPSVDLIKCLVQHSPPPNVFLGFANVASLPAISVPFSTNNDAFFSIQVVAAPCNEFQLLRFAEIIKK